MTAGAGVHRRDLALICELTREIANRQSGLTVLLRDAVPRLELVTPSGIVADVRVDEHDGHFVCRPSFARHPGRDVAAAATALIAFLASCDSGVRAGEP